MGIEKVATLAKSFNKGGWKLAQRTIGQAVPEGLLKMNPTAKTMSTVVVENANGLKKYIWSLKDTNGRTIYTQRKSSDSKDYIVRFYEWLKPNERTKVTAMYQEKVNPYAFENHGLNIKEKVVDGAANQLKKQRYTQIDINDASRTVTRSDATRTNELVDGQLFHTDEARLSEIVSGNKTKEIYQKSQCKHNEVSTVVENTGYGLTEQELQEATSNPYFYAMFKDAESAFFAGVPRAAANQGTNLPAKIFVNEQSGVYGAAYCHNRNYIYCSRDSINKGRKGLVFANLEHELKHRAQHKLVDKLNRGELTNPEEIKLAQEYKKVFENYVSPSKIGQLKEYETQITESEAFVVTDKVSGQQSKSVDFLQALFTKARRATLGE